MEKKISLRFLGGAGTVTGSKILVEYNDQRILIDCGMFQGLKELRLRNWKQLPVDPSTIDAVILTHAHLDHCGHIPALVKNGFNGKVHCTVPTRDLAELILKDSAKIQEEDAERANRHGYTKHKPAKPLYDFMDTVKALTHFTTHSYHEWVILNNDMKFQLKNSGHILGSSLIELRINNKTFVFSGDLGRTNPLILHPAEYVKTADVVIMESTYGDRLHAAEDPKDVIHRIIWETFNRKGILMIPTFTVERAQELLYLLSELEADGKLPSMPIYLDSPMGVHATEIMLRHTDWHPMDKKECYAMHTIAKLIVDIQDSKMVGADPSPKIVLAGSGMLSGGRILHYLNKYGGDARNTILMGGFQAAGTRGRALLEGAKEIKFFGKFRAINAQVEQITALSAHADQREILKWLGHLKTPPQQVILNHGEPHQSDTLRLKIQDELGYAARVAKNNEVVYFDV